METDVVYEGNCIEQMKNIEDNSIQCVVTSPPYWGLRDYGHAEQIGLEESPEKYVQNLVKVFSEVKRVLKSHGTIWLNLGDTYYSKGGASRHKGYNDPKYPNGRTGEFEEPQTKPHKFLKPKDLVGIPWRVAFALQEKLGLYLRQAIIWHKPNAMPSSVKDRPVTDYEFIFLLSKSEKYFYDYEAVLEPHKNPEDVKYRIELRNGKKYNTKQPYKNNVPYAIQPRDKEIVEYRNLPDLKEFSNFINNRRKELKYTIDEIENLHDSQAPHHWFNGESFPSAEDYKWLKDLFSIKSKYDKQMLTIYKKSSEKTTRLEGRNCRAVWSFNTQPFPEAHFAVFPEELPKRCIKAGTREGDIVLDIFAGSGTALWVAKKLNRRYIGIELSKKYVSIINKRLSQETLHALKFTQSPSEIGFPTENSDNKCP